MKTPEEIARGIMPLIHDMEDDRLIREEIAAAIAAERAKADALAEALREVVRLGVHPGTATPIGRCDAMCQTALDALAAYESEEPVHG